MANKVILWLRETEEVLLDNSDDTDADPSYKDPVELRENESDRDISSKVRIDKKFYKPLVQEVVIL